MSEWNAAQYLKFEDERTRAARDLLAQVPLRDARRVVDLGCGPGNSTELVARRYPGASVSGIDLSEDMLRQARARLPECDFVLGNLIEWTPDEGVDLVFANASYQWVPDHLTAIRRVVEKLAPGGVLAVQMPNNTREPTHVAMTKIAQRFGVAEGARADLPPAGTYYDALTRLCGRLDIWETAYQHVMPDVRAIAEWFRGSALQSFLERLDAERGREFLDAYVKEIEGDYPAAADGKVLLRFPRFFLVAVRG